MAGELLLATRPARDEFVVQDPGGEPIRPRQPRGHVESPGDPGVGAGRFDQRPAARLAGRRLGARGQPGADPAREQEQEREEIREKAAELAEELTRALSS